MHHLWLSDSFLRPQRLPKSLGASTLVGGSPSNPQLCHGEAEVLHWCFAVTAAMVVMAAIALSMLLTKAIALPSLHSEQR